MNPWFYRSTIKNLTVAVLDVFNDIEVHRTDAAGVETKVIKVPIKFGPTDKIFQYRTQEESGKMYYISSPSLALVLESIQYDADRASSTHEMRYFYDEKIGLSDMDSFWSDVNPVPYNFNFKLYIKCDNMDDWSQIIENILPFFNPALNLRVKEFSFLNIERNIQLLYNDLNVDFLLEQGEEDRRYVNGDISFTAKAFMYRPITNTKLIKQIETKFFLTNSDNTSAVNTSTYSVSGETQTSAFPSVFSTSGTDYDSLGSQYYWFKKEDSN